MKRFIMFMTAVLSCAAVIACGAFSAFAESIIPAAGFNGDTSNCRVYDNKGLFTDKELKELDELVQETAEEIDMYIAIYLSDTARSEGSTQFFSDETYEELFGANSDGVFYYMDLSEQYSAYDYISTSGKAILLYDDHIDSMLSSIFNYLPASGEPITADEIAGGINKICQTFRAYSREPKNNEYKYIEYNDTYVYYKDGETVISSSKPAAVRLKNALLFGLPSGLIVGFLFFFITKSNYKFRKSCNPHVYVAREETNFTQREDRFIRTYTTKTKIESSSSSGGGGGSHGGSGSHGGGGGHR